VYIGRRTRNCARISLESLTPVSLLWLPDAPGVRGRRLAPRSCLSLESLAPVSVRWLQENLGKHRCQCGCAQVVDLQARHYRHGVPRFIHGHHNRRGHWLVLQLREAGYRTWPRRSGSGPRACGWLPFETVVRRSGHQHRHRRVTVQSSRAGPTPNQRGASPKGLATWQRRSRA
jgi:hypothetical protein